jgi:hypothetical protein
MPTRQPAVVPAFRSFGFAAFLCGRYVTYHIEHRYPAESHPQGAGKINPSIGADGVADPAAYRYESHNADEVHQVQPSGVVPAVYGVHRIIHKWPASTLNFPLTADKRLARHADAIRPMARGPGDRAFAVQFGTRLAQEYGRYGSACMIPPAMIRSPHWL